MNINEIEKLFLNPNHLNIPDEYKDGAGTYMSTVKGIIDFIENITNSRVKKHILSSLEIDDKIIEQKDIMVNANVLLEIEKEMLGINLDEKHMNMMSFFINNKNEKRSTLPKFLETAQSDFEIASKLVELSNNTYDKNFTYHIEQKGDRFKVVGVSNEEIHDVIKKRVITGDMITHFKAYTVANTTINIFGKPMNLIEVNNYYKNNRQYQEYIFKDRNFRPLQ